MKRRIGKSSDAPSVDSSRPAGDYDVVEMLREWEKEMQGVASKLEFEKAALLRDQIMDLKKGAENDKDASAKDSKAMHATYSRPRRTRKTSSSLKR